MVLRAVTVVWLEPATLVAAAATELPSVFDIIFVLVLFSVVVPVAVPLAAAAAALVVEAEVRKPRRFIASVSSSQVTNTPLAPSRGSA
jgi:hypothetical protein